MLEKDLLSTVRILNGVAELEFESFIDRDGARVDSGLLSKLSKCSLTWYFASITVAFWQIPSIRMPEQDEFPRFLLGD